MCIKIKTQIIKFFKKLFFCYNNYVIRSKDVFWCGGQVVRRQSAKLIFVGSIPARTLFFCEKSYLVVSLFSIALFFAICYNKFIKTPTGVVFIGGKAFSRSCFFDIIN